MITANRPYSANDVSQALRDLGKSAVQKSLDSLVDNGSLYVKEYNKQKIYCVVQRDELSSRDEVEELDLKVNNMLITKLKANNTVLISNFGA